MSAQTVGVSEIRRALGVALADARQAGAELASLAFPTNCVGCDAPGTALCVQCQAALRPHAEVHELAGSLLRVHSGLPYEGVTARVIRAVKGDARPNLARALAPALGASLDRLEGEVDAAPASVLVVPVPTSAASMRARGFRFVEHVARCAGVDPFPALHLVRRTHDQRGLDRTGREANLRGSMRSQWVGGRTVVIIDDVVTTGATLIEAARALTAAGAVVVGAATIAATARKTRAVPDTRETHRKVVGDFPLPHG